MACETSQKNMELGYLNLLVEMYLHEQFSYPVASTNNSESILNVVLRLRNDLNHICITRKDMEL